jgi:hypothetical protein
VTMAPRPGSARLRRVSFAGGLTLALCGVWSQSAGAVPGEPDPGYASNGVELLQVLGQPSGATGV